MSNAHECVGGVTIHETYSNVIKKYFVTHVIIMVAIEIANTTFPN